MAQPFDDISLMATAKANMGFALLASGRIDAGKRLADEAVADYERAGAAAETAGLLGEYAQYLEGAGDFKAALALVHRERALYDLISSAAHNRAVLELQSRYEGERRRLEIERLQSGEHDEVGGAPRAAAHRARSLAARRRTRGDVHGRRRALPQAPRDQHAARAEERGAAIAVRASTR